MATRSTPTAVPSEPRRRPAATAPHPSHQHVPRPPWAPVLRMERSRSASTEEESGRGSAPNRTGLPDRLKAGVEALSGLAMDDVQVRRSSPEPAKLGALAYTRGREIHLGPGQEQHLPHEAWHVVQQKQGRVAPTAQLKAGAPLNDDMALEREADVMGARAITATGMGDRNVMARPAATSGIAPACQESTVQKRSRIQATYLPGATPLQAEQGVIQRAAFRYLAGQPDEVVNVEADEHQVTVNGQIRVENEIRQVSGSVSLHPTQVRESEIQAGGNPDTMIPALRVFGLQAQPRGLRLGQLLTLRHGQIAAAQNLDYVVARDVSGAGGPFYLPLGFRDFIGRETWQSLHDRRNELDQLILNPPDLPPPPSGLSLAATLLEAKVAVVEELARVAMFIRTEDLIANSTAAIANVWGLGGQD